MKNINCVFDGACEPKNPGGAMGMGAAFFEEKKLLKNHSSFEIANKSNTNNVAEYKAFLWLLDELIKFNLTKEKVSIYGDSKLVINQMLGEYKINAGNYVPYAIKAKDKIKLFEHINFIWVPREKNSYADSLSKKALIENKIKIAVR